MNQSENPQAATYWRRCSACKKPIAFNQIYQVCSVSTCSKKRSGFVFCSVPCWASHVPTFRHRDAWAIEERTPTRENWLKEQAEEMAASTPARATVPSTAKPETISERKVSVPMTSSPSAPVSEAEILVVVSKLKSYIKAKADMNTSADVIDLLSDRLRRLCDAAIVNARNEGRKTVMARDFRS